MDGAKAARPTSPHWLAAPGASARSDFTNPPPNLSLVAAASSDSPFSQISPETPSFASEARQYGFPGFGLRHHFAAERKWALCLQSRAHPREIITTEVLKALQELNVCWKKIEHYNMKCRWSPDFVENMMHNQSIGSTCERRLPLLPLYGTNVFKLLIRKLS